MDITLVIPAYNEARYIGRCLDSIDTYAHGRFREVIVVDNGSNDETGTIATHKGARVVVEPEKGITRARQRGLDAVSSEYIAFIDADCILTDEWFDRMSSHFSHHPDTVALTGPIRYYDGSRAMRVLVIAIQWVVFPIAYLCTGRHVIGGNFVARVDALKKIGGFDSQIAFYGEDGDIGRRLAAVGPVRPCMSMIVGTSMRRLTREGIVRTYARYVANFASHMVLRRSLTKVYIDVR